MTVILLMLCIAHHCSSAAPQHLQAGAHKEETGCHLEQGWHPKVSASPNDAAVISDQICSRGGLVCRLMSR